MKVCIISEGCYPIVRGGLSEWAHLLMKSLKEIEFDILCISPNQSDKPVYEKLPNINSVVITPLQTASSLKKSSAMPKWASERVVNLIKDAFYGEALDFESLMDMARTYPLDKGWLTSRSYWDFLVDTYRKNYSWGPFTEYYWTIYGLCSLLFDCFDSKKAIPQADVYHCLSTGFAGVVGSMAKVLYSTPLIITEQGLYLVERQDELSRQDVSEWYRGQLVKFSESIVKTSYKYADRIIPPCRSHVAIEERLGADPGKIQVINNGIEVNRFVPVHKNGSRPVVGCFARVVPIKGITTLIRAAKMVNERCPTDFFVVGDIQDKPYHQQCLQLVRELGLEGRFKFTGHTDPLEWYHRVDVFTLSSNSEGVPYALLEAMSCGLPCVCTSVGGVPEIIADGVGYVVPPAEPGSLADKLIELLQNRELRMQLGQHATRVANAKYTIGEMSEKFRQIYRGLAYERDRI